MSNEHCSVFWLWLYFCFGYVCVYLFSFVLLFQNKLNRKYVLRLYFEDNTMKIKKNSINHNSNKCTYNSFKHWKLLLFHSNPYFHLIRSFVRSQYPCLSFHTHTLSKAKHWRACRCFSFQPMNAFLARSIQINKFNILKIII